MSMMDFAEAKKAVDAITTDWSIRGPYHEESENVRLFMPFSKS